LISLRSIKISCVTTLSYCTLFFQNFPALCINTTFLYSSRQIFFAPDTPHRGRGGGGKRIFQHILYTPACRPSNMNAMPYTRPEFTDVQTTEASTTTVPTTTATTTTEAEYWNWGTDSYSYRLPSLDSEGRGKQDYNQDGPGTHRPGINHRKQAGKSRWWLVETEN
jgi:hypothetical protein